VIKRIVLACAGDEFATALTAPPDVRPVRVASCTVLPDLTPGPPHDGIGLEWFSDDRHLERFETWSADALREPVQVLVAQEHVMRGADWLQQRWRDRGPKVKHMAIARRAAGLTPAQFVDRWRNRAGRVGAVPIPVPARGRAYVQNHPLARVDGEWPYDAVNEVYFDDLDGLRDRIAWFAENLDGQEDDLVGESWFVAVREEVL
jgi:hypothetical protein